jgi:hypothetical protein
MWWPSDSYCLPHQRRQRHTVSFSFSAESTLHLHCYWVWVRELLGGCPQLATQQQQLLPTLLHSAAPHCRHTWHY